MDSEIGGFAWAVHIITKGNPAIGLAIYLGTAIGGGWLGSLFRKADNTKKALEKDDKTQEIVKDIIDKHIGITEADKARRVQDIISSQTESEL